MDNYFEPGLYLLNDMPTNIHVTILDVAVSFVFGVLLICLLTFTLERWYQEEIKEMKEQWQLLEFEQTKDQSRL